MAGKRRSPPTDWRAVFEEARERHRALGAKPFALDRLAWQDTCGEWARWHGTPAPAGICAGCGERLHGAQETMIHGDAIHWREDCLKLYAARWRAEAEAALRALGLERPEPIGEA